MTDHDDMFVCEHCGHPTSIASDVCPNCGEPMGAPVAAGKKPAHDDLEDDLSDDALLSDKEIAAGAEENTVSLDALRAEEEEDEPAYGSEYGNE